MSLSIKAVECDLSPSPSLSDVKDAINRLKNSKGPDSVPGELFKFGSNLLENILRKRVVDIWTQAIFQKHGRKW